jgi:hypothetical protein
MCLAMSEPIRRSLEGFKWPSKTPPTEDLWAKCGKLMLMDAQDCNKRYVKRMGGANWIAGLKGKAAGLKGGRPPEKPKKLPRNARLVQRGLDKGMKRKDIADLLDITPMAVSDYIRRYDLQKQEKQ